MRCAQTARDVSHLPADGAAPNPDFARFLQDAKIDFESRKIHKSDYGEIITDRDEYIAKLMGE